MTGADAYLAALGIAPEFISARGLRRHPEAAALELAEVGADGREHFLVAEAAGAWRQMRDTAQDDGVSLTIVSAFRSIDRQAEIIRRKIEAGAAVEEILRVSAPPGYSEHHTGRAVDLSTPGCRALEVAFDQTAAFAWLSRRASEFGFVLSYPDGNVWGYQYEPWHWCFNGAEPALLSSS